MAMNKWRAKNYKLRVGRYKTVSITIRRFNTQKFNRSKNYRQLVIPLEIGLVKEFAFRVERKKYRRSRKDYRHLKPRFVKHFSTGLFISGLLGMIVFGHQIALGQAIEPPTTFSSVHKKVVATQKIKLLKASVPINITIPSVNIDSLIIPVGLNPDSSIQLPPILSPQTGWYKSSPTPGEIGPSVIVGHVDNYESVSVFWRLRYVKPGDMVLITRTDGTIVHFRVDALSQYDQNNFPTQQVYGNISYPGLRIITCGGNFDTKTASYSQNTVVYASIVSD
jgi:sortase (surface protein transpeptidase)